MSLNFLMKEDLALPLLYYFKNCQPIILVKVLIIEKDRKISESLSFFIENQMKCKVVIADSRKEAESLYGQSTFEMVICGEPLPDGEALELLEAWMNQNPKLISILMTVKSDEHLRQEALKAGVSGYLVKPFDLRQLEEIMDLSKL